MLGYPIGKAQVGVFLRARRTPRHHTQRHVVDHRGVARLHQQPPRQGFHGLAGPARIGQAIGQQQTQVLLGGHDRDGLLGGVGRDDDLGEDLDDPARGFRVERPVQGHDAAEGGSRIATQGTLVGLGEARPLGDAARVGMLDDRHSGRAGRVELGDALVGGVGVVEVVVGEFLALELAGGGDAGPGRAGRAVEGRALVGVLSVAERLGEAAAEGPEGWRRVRLDLAREPIRDGGIVGGRSRIGLLGEAAPGALAQRPALGFEFGEHGGVVAHIDHDRHVGVIFRGGADHCRTADIDVLDAIVVAGSLRHRLLEGIEVDQQQVDRADAVGSQRRLMLRVAAHGEQSAMDARVQRLHPTVHHLGKAGEVGDLRDGQPGRTQGLVRPTRGDQRDAEAVESSGELDEAGLVGDGEECAGDPHLVMRHGVSSGAKYEGTATRELVRAYHEMLRCGQPPVSPPGFGTGRSPTGRGYRPRRRGRSRSDRCAVRR
ncbi:hypothetical protein CFIICLFH_2231 [Methylobacterium goesingense]|nr:hypothetical protein CFIICLFH_2231 [Methylobacterium goesingense]